MKTILVATDFSPAAVNASEYAAEMAISLQAEVQLLHVYNLPVNYSEVPVALSVEDLEKGAEIQLNDAKDELLKKTGGKIKITTQLRMGTFFHELRSVCENLKPYAVVMGSQGSTAAERLFFGGHTVHAMKHLEWPLITVPKDAKYAAVKNIGLACDFDKVVDTTPVEEIKLLVSDFQARLHVLNTGRKEVYNPELVFESGLLQEMLYDLKPQYHFITAENTDEGIMEFAEKNNIDLLIVLPKRHGLLDQLRHKSHTKQFVLHSHVPVMALH